MTWSVESFGQTPEGEAVALYHLENRQGVKVGIMTYGATLVNLLVPDRLGVRSDIVLGFDTLEPYLGKHPYFGCVVGRYANRIARGQFQLHGTRCQLSINDAAHHLHGGFRGLDKKNWHARVLPDEPASIVMTTQSADGEEGYPGNLDVTVRYSLSEENELRIDYAAGTDRPTVVNLTNHSYFNLSGAGTICQQVLWLSADEYTPVDAAWIPTGEILSVAGTGLDFRRPMAIGARMPTYRGEPAGYNHNYVLTPHPDPMRRLAAQVIDPVCGRSLNVYSDQPGIQLYTANYFDGSIRGKGGAFYRQHAGFCLETQHFPDSPHHPHFPSTVLMPESRFQSSTIYQLGW